MNRKQSEKRRPIAMVLAVLLLLTAAVPALAESFSAIVTSNSMAVFRDAAMTRAYGTLGKYTVVKVVDYEGKAAKISYSGRTGYASLNDMQSIEAVGVKAVVNRTTKVYRSASTRSRSATVKAGTQLYVLKIAQGWAFVEKNGVTGYMSAKALTKADDNWQTPDPGATPTPSPAPTQASGLQGRVSAAKLVVYKKANTSSGKVMTLKQGQLVSVMSWNGYWLCWPLNTSRGGSQYGRRSFSTSQ